MLFNELIYSDIISVSYDKMFEINRVSVKYPFKPRAGQYISIIFPKELEIPLTVGDYDEENKVLTLFIESQKLITMIQGKKKLLIKGPLGKPINFSKTGNVLGIIRNKKNYLDLRYTLKVLSESGSKVNIYCLEKCDVGEFETVKSLQDSKEYDLILASVPESDVKTLPLNALVYVRWVKMNCNLGVCGECNYNGILPCVEGPFVEVRELVDQR
ncbi:MAG: hypothetical protein RXQ98_02195 [Sulfolobaceae archaeon]